MITKRVAVYNPPSFGWITCPECEGRGTVRSIYEVDEADLEVEEG